MRKEGMAGFTLVEILVVISIIAVLASIMVPVFITMGRTNKQNTCINNLRQVGIALTLYRQDYGVYPPAPRPDYLQSLGKLPAAMPFSDVSLVTPAFPQGSQPAGDLTAGGYFNGPNSVSYLIQIEELANPTAVLPDLPTFVDTFKVSTDNGATWTPATGGRNITGTSQGLGNGVSIRFAQTTGHTVGQRWTVYAGPQLLPDRSDPDYPNGWKEWVAETATLTQPAATTELLLRLDHRPNTVQYALLSNGQKSELVRFDPSSVVDTGTDFIIDLTSALKYSYAAGTRIIVGYSYAEFDNPSNPLSDSQQVAIFRTAYQRHTTPPSFPAGNYGLAMLYRLYVDDTRDYLRSFQFYHCPTLRSTEVVDRGGNVSSLLVGTEGAGGTWTPNDAAPYRQVDPLWNGFNSYDVTYNYDQYYNNILAYDYAQGSDALNISRQLRNPSPPADTVVAFCYAHRGDNRFQRVLDANNTVEQPVLTIPIPAANDTAGWRDVERQVRYAEGGLRADQDIVLWLDGTAMFWRPTLVKGRDSVDGKLQYFRVPPFLATRGE